MKKLLVLIVLINFSGCRALPYYIKGEPKIRLTKKLLILVAPLILGIAAGCELTVGFIYEDKISPTQSVKTTVELKKFQLGDK